MKAFQAEAQKFFPVSAICDKGIVSLELFQVTYLDVGVLGDELNEPLEAVQEVAGGPEKDLHDLVVLVRLHDLPLVVLEDDSDHLNEGD